MVLFNCSKKCDCNKSSCVENIKLEATDLPKIALVGNPNVGKSVIFNALSGFYSEVSNFPGTTVDVTKAFLKEGAIIDTPGAYSLGNYSEDEVVTRKIVECADVVINVVSALSLERDLFLTQQLIDLDVPLIIVVNQTDEAAKKGLKINYDLLESRFDAKVIPTVAIRNQGISDILKSISNKDYRVSKSKTPFIENHFKEKRLKECKKLCEFLKIEENPELKDRVYSEIRNKINHNLADVVTEGKSGIDFAQAFGNLLLNPFGGFLITAIMLYLLYQVVGVFIAGEMVDFLENEILLQYYTPWISNEVSKVFQTGAVNHILVGEFGLLTMTVQYIIGVLLPLIIGFYLFMSMLEDSGYLPRLAVITDRFLTRIGLNGRAVIPLILGFGCVTMATITTRILGSKRERSIATAILGLTVPCSAQLGVILGLMAVIGSFKAWIIYLASILAVLVIVGTALNKLLPGKSTSLFIDLPPMRLPLLKNVLNKTFTRTWYFLKEATPLFALGSLIISTMEITKTLPLIQKAMEPVVTGMLALPRETANIFIMGLIRRDFGAAGLADMAGVTGGEAVLTNIQLLVSLVVITLFVPCLAALIVIYKERGFKEATLIFVGSITLAILTGTILSGVLPLIF